MPRTAGPHAVTFVFITVLLDTIGVGLVIPVLPGIIRTLTGADLPAASVIGGWLYFANAGMQFAFGPIIGNLSDAYGRRPVLLLSVLGLGLDFVLTAFAPSILWLLAGRLIAGIFGASYTTANAFIADVTPADQRAKAFGLMGAAFGLGFVLGPAIGGLLGEYGPRVPFFVAAGLSLANVAYGYFVLPETLKPENRRPFSIRRANPVGSLLSLRQHRGVIALAVAVFVYFIAQAVYPSVWTYSTMARFGWSESMVGISLAFWGITFAAIQGGLVGPIIRRIGERRGALVGLVSAVVVFFGYAFADKGWMFFALILIGALQGITMPSIGALMSRGVPPDAQGELAGAIAGIQSIAQIAGAVLMTQVYSFSGSTVPILGLPGAPFLMAALLSTAAGAIFIATRPPKPL